MQKGVLGYDFKKIIWIEILSGTTGILSKSTKVGRKFAWICGLVKMGWKRTVLSDIKVVWGKNAF